jgi:hypothetical protein
VEIHFIISKKLDTPLFRNCLGRIGEGGKKERGQKYLSYVGTYFCAGKEEGGKKEKKNSEQ